MKKYLLLASCVLLLAHAEAASLKACTREYRPVCGVLNRAKQTFPNLCIAKSQGAQVLKTGACNDLKPKPILACTEEYRPVCAKVGNRYLTFSNECKMSRKQATLAYKGKCRTRVTTRPNPADYEKSDLFKKRYDFFQRKYYGHQQKKKASAQKAANRFGAIRRPKTKQKIQLYEAGTTRRRRLNFADKLRLWRKRLGGNIFGQ